MIYMCRDECGAQCVNGKDNHNRDWITGQQVWMVLYTAFLNGPHWCSHVGLSQMSIALLGDYFSVGAVGLDAIFEKFQRFSRLSLSFRELAIKKLLWDSAIVHPDNMSCPSELSFQDHGFSVIGFCVVQILSRIEHKFRIKKCSNSLMYCLSRVQVTHPLKRLVRTTVL